MALINCPECGKQISDHAPICPHCGIPIKNATESNKKRILLCIELSALVAIIVFLTWYLINNNHGQIGHEITSDSTNQVTNENTIDTTDYDCQQKEIKLTPILIEAWRKYAFVDFFQEGYARVRDNRGKWGFINSKGKETIPCIYDECYCFLNGQAVVINKRNWTFGYINTNGDTIVPINIKMKKHIGCSDEFPDGYSIPNDYPQSLGKRYDWSDTGTFQGDLEWYSIPHEGSYISEELWGIRHRTGEIVIPAKYCSHGDFHEGMAVVNVDLDGFYMAYGFVSDKGEEVIPIQYMTCTECSREEVPSDFINGLAHVCIKDGEDRQTVHFISGVIDKFGNSTFTNNQIEHSRRMIQKFCKGNPNYSIYTNPPGDLGL